MSLQKSNFGNCLWVSFTAGALLLSCQSKNATPTASAPAQCAVSATPALSKEALTDRHSRGERTLFRQDDNLKRDSGNAAFRSGKYDDAIRLFEQAVQKSNNEPESQIYLNNAKALRRSNNPYRLAIVVPASQQDDVAKEMLRGAADAQTQFNQANGTDDRLLELTIFDDGEGDDANPATPPQVAPQIACLIARDASILGVVGHNSSDATTAALPEYEQANLAVVSPTATSAYLQSKVFFRTVPNDQVSAALLAKYAIAQNFQKVTLFYFPGSPYSKSITESFKQAYEGAEREVIVEDMEKKDFDGQKQLEATQNGGTQAIVLFPPAIGRDSAMELIQRNAALPKPLPLLGGDALYHPDTLVKGKAMVKDLVVIAPCPFLGTSYTDGAEQRWLGQVSWRTSCSFDATQALIATLNNQPISRQTTLERLSQIKLDANADSPQTSGEMLQFTPDHERISSTSLVKAGANGDRPRGADLGFELLTK
jgi:branched-chain amino acid transport system substrate-binding protein